MPATDAKLSQGESGAAGRTPLAAGQTPDAAGRTPLAAGQTPDAAGQTPDAAADQRVLRLGCGLLDRSERGKLALTGAGAATFLNGQVTNDVERLQAGEGCYAAFLTHKGKMLGDLRILRTENELLLDTERVALQGLFDMIRRFKIGYEVELHKRTLEFGLLSLIGPNAREVTAAALDQPDDVEAPPAALDSPPAALDSPPAALDSPPGADALPPEAEHSHRAVTIAGHSARLISTARPEGVDVLCEAAGEQAVRAALIDAGARAVSEDAAEVLRVEHGVPRFGRDIEQESVIPQEAGLNERAVSFTKGCYVGQETVARLHYRGKPNRLLRGLLLQRPAAPGEEVRQGGRRIGRLGSCVISDQHGPIALALLRREADPGTSAAIGGDEIAATVVELPFASPR